MEILREIAESLNILKEKKPLIHHITNYVTVNDCANMVLALGASPVMADDINEVVDMAALSSALVLNMGTLNTRTIESMIIAGQKANALGIPVIFDPVGVGATPLRNEAAKKILDTVRLSVIRGNMSEIKILAGFDVKIKGVDSVADDSNGETVARETAKRFDTVVAITGKTDFISDGSRILMINNGHEMLTQVTGSGCMTTSLVGSFCGAVKDGFLAAAAGVVTMGIAGELAYKMLAPSDGIGSFRVRLFDIVGLLTGEVIKKEAQISLDNDFTA